MSDLFGENECNLFGENKNQSDALASGGLFQFVSESIQTSAQSIQNYTKRTIEDVSSIAGSAIVQMARMNSEEEEPCVSSGRKRTTLPSHEVYKELESLRQDLDYIYEDEIRKTQLFEKFLSRLWQAAELPGAFSIKSDSWMSIGFQGSNPLTDFRSSGILALKCLTYCFEQHKGTMKVLTANQIEYTMRNEKTYPVCVAGINIVCILADIINLKHDNPNYASYWDLFSRPCGFYELFYITLLKLDTAWHVMDISYMEFSRVLKATKQMAKQILKNGPTTVEELEKAAEMIDVTIFCENTECIND